MPQTIVNFLTQATAGGTLTTAARVFDYEIGSTEQLIYQHLMEDLQTAITGNNTSKIKQILMELNEWSQLKVSTGTAVTTTSKTISDLRSTPLTKLTEVTTMNRYMAEDVDKIIRTFRSAGWDPINTASNVSAAGEALIRIKLPANADIYPVSQWITEGINAASGAVLDSGVRDIEGTSLQQMLMVDYVSHGNDLLFDEMTGLSTAISGNQSALSYLNSLQDLMNQKDPKTFLLALNQLAGITSANSSAYTAFEKASFDQELGTTAKFTADQISTYLTQLNSPTYTVDITTLKANVQSLATMLVPVTHVQVLASAASQYPPALAGHPSLVYFQQGLATFMNDFTAFQVRVGELQALDIGNSSIATLEARVANLKSALETFDITFNDLGFKVSNLRQAAGQGTYSSNLGSAWAAMSTTPFGVNGGPLTHFGTTISTIESQISTMKTSLSNTNAYANSDFSPLWTNAASIVNASESSAYWGTWIAERDAVMERWLGTKRDGTARAGADAGIGVHPSYLSMVAAQINFKNAYANGGTTLNSFATLSDQLAGISDQFYCSIYYDDGVRGAWGTGPHGLAVYADKSFYWRNNGEKYDPPSGNQEMINLLAAINTEYNASQRNPLSYQTSWAADSRDKTKVLFYSNTAARDAIVTKGNNVIGEISPASAGYIGGSFETLKNLIAGWSTTSATKASFLDTYATFQSQITTFAAKKTAFVDLLNAQGNTNPTSSLITAGLELVTALENLDATYITLHANVTAAYNETSGTLQTSIANASTAAFTTAMVSKTPAEWTTTLAAVKTVLSNLTNTTSGSATGAFVNLDDATKTFTANKARIITNLNYLLEQLGITSGASSLTDSLTTLKKDFTDVSDIPTWVQDYTSQQGTYQTHLNNAIVASQSLNDAKREELRQVMFVFEEFYKSSTSMLSRLTQLIEKMASAINR
jgi:hypothetical protein